MKIILLGAPGAGKGTLATRICDKLSIPHISTGQILRNAVRDETQLGIVIKEIMKTGELVSDSIIMEIVKERLSEVDCKNGFVFDGFPRTIAQAKELEKITDIDMIVSIRITNEKLIERISGRRTCPNCGAIYHTSWHKENICSKCNAPLIQREDEKPEIFLERLKVFEHQTAPLIDFYERKGNLVWIDSKDTADETYEQLAFRLLEKKK